jgi:hemoglobin-like flavoprotein
MALNVELLSESFGLVKPRAEEFAHSFYDNLFADYPETQALFVDTKMAEQRMHLVKALAMVVENLRRPDVLSDSLKGLGARHVNYGILPQHYPMVGGSLLKTFESYLGGEWTPEVRQAWVDAYAAITALMLEGAHYPEEILKLGDNS